MELRERGREGDWAKRQTDRQTDWAARQRERGGGEDGGEEEGKKGGEEGKRAKREVVAVRFVRRAGGNRWEPTVTNKSNTNVPAV